MQQHMQLLKLGCYAVIGRVEHETKVGTALSGITELTSGVAQGSVIGPLLYDDVIAEHTEDDYACQLYADDLKLYTTLYVDCDEV